MRNVALALCAIALQACAHRLSQLEGGAPPGPFTVAVLDLSVSVGKRELPVRIHAPRGAGPFPVIVWSHGVIGTGAAYGYLGAFWASHGFVSIHPSHAGGDPDRFEAEDARERAHRLEAVAADPAEWQGRPRDLSAVIGALPRLAQLAPELAGALDLSRIGVGGHSFGAYVALTLAGLRIALPQGGAVDVREPRVRAFVALSPPGAEGLGIDASSWSRVDRPILMMTGPRDTVPGKPAGWREEPFRALPPGEKYLVSVADADHFTFAGIARAGNRAVRADPEQIRAIQLVTLAFWNLQLRGDASARAQLRPGTFRPALDAAPVTVELK